MRFLSCVFIVLVIGGTPLVQAEQVAIPAGAMSAKSSNINATDSSWSGLAVCNGGQGFEQWTAEVKQSREYYIHWRYCAGESRPCVLTINGKTVDPAALGEVTGGYYGDHLTWKTTGPFALEQGKNAIRLTAKNCMPHFRGLVVSTESKAPKASIFDDAIRKQQEAELRENLKKTAGNRAKFRQLFPDVKHVFFVRRYTFQSSHYYTDFIDGCRHFGGNLCLLSLEDGTVEELVPELAGGIFGRCDLSYDAKRIVFGYKRALGEGFRIWEVGIDGKGLRQLTFPPADEAARIAKYRLEWHWGYYHHTDDMHPCYLPDGGICFTSTRCEFGILCDATDILTSSVLYRMDGDGSNIEKLSNNSVSESAPSVMNDGRILYTRWEYIDNGSVTNKALWAVRPDGSGSAEIYGTDIVFPSVFNVGRAVPDTNHLFVCIGAPHMPLGVGTLMKIDIQHDTRTSEPGSYITPEVDVRHQWGWDHVPGGADKPFRPSAAEANRRDGRGNTAAGPLYMDPYPLSREHLLVSHNPDKAWNVKNAYGLYLIDMDGNKELLHQEPEFSCWMPIPVRPRTKPPVLRYTPDKELAERGLARVTVADVYRGLDGVERGKIKYIRINEHVPRPWAARRFWGNNRSPDDCYDQQHSVVSKNAALGLRIQVGTVPVDEDGSAHFLVPADKNIFFQVLDEDFMEVQRERTFVNYRPGEVRSCVGCHEKSQEIPATGSRLPTAMTRDPDMPGPLPGEVSGARPLYYPTDVQPVWDRHCVSCHGGEKTEGDLDLAGTMTTHFSRSYENLLKGRMLPIIGENHPKAGNNHYVPPYTLGSHASKLIKVLREGHYDVKLSTPEWVRVCAWVDSNGQYYGSYYGRKNLAHKDHPNFRPVPTYEPAGAITAPLPEDQR